MSKKSIAHDSRSALGHEIHISRFILYDLLQKNKINENVCIVTLSENRFFLYNKVFKNLITWENYNNIASSENVIDLSYYSLWHTKSIVIDFFKQVNYSFDTFDKSDKFIKLINDINYLDLSDYSEIISDVFFVVHIRFNTNQNKIYNIVHKIHKLYENMIDKPAKCNIVIFAADNPTIPINNTLVINNLQLYASFLNHKNCKLLISEWSGGGQISQYCSNTNIIYYFDNYPTLDYDIHCINYQHSANENNNIFNYWDFKSTTLCNRKYYKTLQDMTNDNNLILF